MLSGTVEPECRRRRRIILLGNAGAEVTAAAPVAVLSAADDAPHRQATKALAHATLHQAIPGSAMTRVRHTDHCRGVIDWAHSIAVN